MTSLCKRLYESFNPPYLKRALKTPTHDKDIAKKIVKMLSTGNLYLQEGHYKTKEQLDARSKEVYEFFSNYQRKKNMKNY